MDPERRRQLAQRGGRRAHELGRAHRFDTEEAAEAGKKGGLITGAQRHAAAADKKANEVISDREMEKRIVAQEQSFCSKCGMLGPEHKMCRGNS